MCSQKRKKYKGLIEERLKEMDEKENVERIQKNKEQEALFEEKLKKTELANLLKRDYIARQCVEIGFDISSPPYKDCYLKLKLHTEQIAEWRKLQTALQNQRTQSSPNQSSITPNYGNYATLKNAFPIDISPIEFSEDVADSFVEFTVTLTFDRVLYST